MASEEIRLRSDLLNTLVVTRDTGKKLGVVSQLWVDIDQQKVVALSLRPNILYGTPQPMLLSSIRQIGDVILVENEDVIEDLDTEAYSSLINCEVITERGDMLGKVRGYKFDIDDGTVVALIIASLGVPLIPDQVVSTYELPIEEIVSSGPERLIVFEGSEDRMVQLSVGVLERLGIGKAPWEREEDGYVMPVRSENQLGTGLRTPVNTPIRQREPVVEETWDDDNWGEPEPRQLRQQEQRAEPLYYEGEDEEDDNWSEKSNRDRYQQPDYIDVQPYAKGEYSDDYDDQYDDKYDDLEEDAWADQEAPAYRATPVNIPERTKAPEYEE
jgi:sporulation protein YlmC with PRC-barrel domain